MFSPGPGPCPYSPPYIWWHASTYGMDSFMNLLPDMFTMIEPGELRSDRANHGAPANGTARPHHAPSMMSSAARSFSPRRLPCPVLPVVPNHHARVLGAPWDLR